MKACNRRDLVKGVGTAGVAASLAAGLGSAALTKAKTESRADTNPNFRRRSDLVESCISSCSDCYRVCKETIDYCLEKGGDHAHKEHLALLMECAELCKGSISAMVCKAKSQKDLCKICADICKQCAKSCEKFKDDEQMQKCAKACNDCADACVKMVEEKIR